MSVLYQGTGPGPVGEGGDEGDRNGRRAVVEMDQKQNLTSRDDGCRGA